jgi:hypothetical protein
LALIRTDGGAIVGYCCTGNVITDMMPESIMMMAITQAKIGLSIKYLAMFQDSP